VHIKRAGALDDNSIPTSLIERRPRSSLARSLDGCRI
jgi:hypothetical protein